jgi:hypothetical protein
MYIPNSRYNQAGVEYILPVVTKEPENSARDQREGIIINKGWMASYHKEPT